MISGTCNPCALVEQGSASGCFYCPAWPVSVSGQFLNASGGAGQLAGASTHPHSHPHHQCRSAQREVTVHNTQYACNSREPHNKGGRGSYGVRGGNLPDCRDCARFCTVVTNEYAMRYSFNSIAQLAAWRRVSSSRASRARSSACSRSTATSTVRCQRTSPWLYILWEVEPTAALARPT